MIEIIPFEETNIIGLRLNGRIEDEQFNQITEKIEEMLKVHKKLRVYAEIEKIGGIPINTLMKDIHFKLKRWRFFEKKAIVSDKKWLENWVAVADRIFSITEVRHFTSDEKEKAMKWIKS